MSLIGPAYAGRKATCDDAAKAMASLSGDQLRRLVAKRCRLDRWTQKAKTCFAKVTHADVPARWNQLATCFAELTPAQVAKSEAAISKLMGWPELKTRISIAEMGGARADALEPTRKAGSTDIQPDARSFASISSDASRQRSVAVMKVCVAKDGTVERATLIKRSGAVAYDQQLVSTVQKTWRFAPRDRLQCRVYRAELAR